MTRFCLSLMRMVRDGMKSLKTRRKYHLITVQYPWTRTRRHGLTRRRFTSRRDWSYPNGSMVCVSVTIHLWCSLETVFYCILCLDICVWEYTIECLLECRNSNTNTRTHRYLYIENSSTLSTLSKCHDSSISKRSQYVFECNTVPTNDCWRCGFAVTCTLFSGATRSDQSHGTLCKYEISIDFEW